MQVRIYDGASQIGSAKYVADGNGGNRYTSWWTGLSKTSANLSDFRVRVYSNGGGPCYCYEVTAEWSVTAL